MSNTMTLISLITSKVVSKGCVDGTATYRPNASKFKDFDFKLFIGRTMTLILLKSVI